MTPLAVTGVGVASPLGVGREAVGAALREGRAAPFGPPTQFKAEGARVAELRDFNAAAVMGDKGLRTTDRLTRLFLVATRLALADAGIKRAGAWTALGPDAVGVCAATAYGSLEAITELDRVAKLEDPRYLNPSKFPNTVINSALGYVSIWEDLRAFNVTVVNGETGAVDAIGCAAMYLAAGRAQAVVAGGGEALHEGLWLAFERLGLAREVVLGEGAAMLVLEPADAARRRGARARMEVVGYGTAYEPPPRAAALTHASAEALERALVDALADADVAPGDVDVVASGAAGLGPWDAAERAALAAVFGERPCVACPKALAGESLGAAGALALAQVEQWFDGAPVALSGASRGAAPAEARVVVVPSLGFYGNASALVVRRPE